MSTSWLGDDKYAYQLLWSLITAPKVHLLASRSRSSLEEQTFLACTRQGLITNLSMCIVRISGSSGNLHKQDATPQAETRGLLIWGKNMAKHRMCMVT